MCGVGPAAGNAFAGQERTFETFGPAQGVAAFQQAQHCFRFECLAALHLIVFAYDDVRHVPAFNRHAQAFAKAVQRDPLPR